ncbi:hypothetical protein M9435_004944 [Picochlorum sp. BPE23]|nr:hypothetical protein M9435_004944 [Picochlorum sp. BPE23]
MQGDWFTTTPRRREAREGVSKRNNATGQSGIAAASTNFVHSFVTVDSTEHRQVIDITDNVREAVQSACTPSAQSGIVTISSMHTTCAIMVNENEHFLCEDVLQHLNTLVPPTGEYGHNNLDKRPATERDAEAIRKNEYGGFGSIEAFMKNEPVNAHAHIQSILVGNSTSLGVEEGELMIGSWQSVLMLELDGPRQNRKVSISCLLSSSSS